MIESYRKKLLLIEDDPAMVEIIRTNLEITNFEVANTSTTLEEAEKHIAQLNFTSVDVVLLDDNIEGIHVTERFARVIRESDINKEVTIIGISNNSNIYDENSGIDGYLDKCEVWIPGRIQSIIDARKII